MSILLQAREVSHSAGEKPLFAELGIAIDEGDRLALVGHNGSGKSTLLSMLSGKLIPDQGSRITRRGLRLEMVEQFLPEDLAGVPALQAVERKCEAASQWQAASMLDLLAFERRSLATPVGDLSGGQQNRLMLARALVAQPDLLLLDEPTNHLDLQTLVLFEQALNAFRGALLMVSHDRRFLDTICDKTLILRDQRLYRFSANYSSAVIELQAMDEAAAKNRAAEERKIDSLKVSAKRLATWGKIYDSEKLTRRAKSIEKRVERLEEQKTFVTDGSPLDLKLALDASRAKQIVAIDQLQVSVPATDGRAGLRDLFRIAELVIRPGERVALLGHNGSGKTTLIRQLIAASEHPEGTIRFSPQTSLGYYDQELDEVAGEESMIAFARRRVDVPEQTVRQTLITAGFRYNEHDKRVYEMSGGERARLLFVVLGLNRPNFLILDEPTNHIDIAGKEQLETQLLESGATLLITSHDRAFLSAIANRFLMIDAGRLIEIPELQTFLSRLTGEAQSMSSASAVEVNRDAPVQAIATERLVDQPTDISNPETEVLHRIVDLEEKLAADQKRKLKFQKPSLQVQWQTQIDELYRQLDEPLVPPDPESDR